MSLQPKNGKDVVGDTLRFDPVRAVETIFGDSVETNPGLAALSHLATLSHLQTRREILEMTDDTFPGLLAEDFLRIVGGLGFNLAHKETGLIDCCGLQTSEMLFLVRGDGVLIITETYGGKYFNNPKFFGNLRVAEYEQGSCHLTSGFFSRVDSEVWVFAEGAVEGLAYRLGKLGELGQFVVPWVERPTMHLLTHAEKQLPYPEWDRVQAARIAALPNSIKYLIGLTES